MVSGVCAISTLAVLSRTVSVRQPFVFADVHTPTTTTTTSSTTSMSPTDYDDDEDGEIDITCPCLDNMKKGPCAESFLAAGIMDSIN